MHETDIQEIIRRNTQVRVMFVFRKVISGSCEKFKNVILFTDYIKCGSQTFDC